MKYVFKQIDDYTPSETTVEFTADTIGNVLDQFQLFLKGCGFVFNGQLDVIPDEEYYGTGLDPVYGDHGGGSTPDMYDEIDVLSTKSSHYFDTERNK